MTKHIDKTFIQPITTRRQRRVTFSNLTTAQSTVTHYQRENDSAKAHDNARDKKHLPLMLSLCVAASIGLSGCGDKRSHAHNDPDDHAEQAEQPEQAAKRPMILGNIGQCADLYWNGQLTDSKGYRWDVFIIPGIAPPLSGAADSYARAGGYVRRYGSSGLFEDGKKNKVGELYYYAGSTCVGDYMIGGVGRDYRHTSKDIGDLFYDKPFGWYANVGARSIWGYVIKPAGRLVTGTIASAVTATVATAGGVFEGTGRVLLAAGDIVIAGTIVPAAKIAWHQPAYLVSLFNAEPKLEHDGKWGLHIVNHTPPAPSEAPTDPQNDAHPDTQVN